VLRYLQARLRDLLDHLLDEMPYRDDCAALRRRHLR
jgi:hypothetical protein